MIKRLAPFLLLASIALGCSKPDANEPVDTPSGDNVRVTLSSAEGSEDLLFDWEKVDFDSDKTKKMCLILSDGEKPLYGKFSSEANSNNRYASYSGLAVFPHESDAHYADFQSVDYYRPNDLAQVKYCYTVSGGPGITEDAKNGKHICRMEMPAAFTQVADKDPGFLREYMQMYAVSEYKDGKTTLSFNQIPAFFTFNVTNATARKMTLQEVYLNVESKDNVASKFADVIFDWKNGQAGLAYDAGYEVISVSTGEGVTLSKDQKYTAYAFALPLADKDAFKGKVVNVGVKCGDFEYVALQLDGDKIAQMNGSDTYNWVGGKTYTIEVSLNKDLEVSGKVVADKMLELSSNFLWTYTLKYENANGQPLSDYESICTLPVEQTTYYSDFIGQNVAPREAESIGMYDSDETRIGSFPTADLRPSYSETPLYTFGLLSDVHIGKSSSAKADSDFENALNFFNSKNVEMTCICGDITENNKETEYAKYAQIAAKSNAPVYTTTGNHDCKGDTGVNVEWWTQYTGQPLVFEKTIEKNGKTDHFLFFGMSYYNFSSAYLEENFVWLEEKLEAYRNERCFVITHLFFPDRAGNMNDVYPSGNWLKGEQLARMKALCDRYVNTLWFSGHSHWKWSLQQYQDRANIYRNYSGNQAASGWCIHVPSCAEPITSDGTTRVSAPAESEGAIVKVYENYIDILGMDLLNSRYIPIATYRLDTSLQEVAAKNPSTDQEETHYITASNFSQNVNKKEGATVVDVEGMPNYVDVTFTAAKQGFHVYNSTYSSAATGARITVEDVQAFSNGTPVDLPTGVGFYAKSGYFLTTTTSALVYTDAAYPGVHFHTSSSYTSPLPITIRMKAQVEFY